MTADPARRLHLRLGRQPELACSSSHVLDGGGQPVPDPASGNTGADNVLFEIVTNPAGGATPSANSVSGPGHGHDASRRTRCSGVATASFQSGTRAGSDPDPRDRRPLRQQRHQRHPAIRSRRRSRSSSPTASSTASRSPRRSSRRICRASRSMRFPAMSPAAARRIPPDPDATLSLAVSALGTDRQGNPVLPGTPIRFGSVDEPVGAPGTAQRQRLPDLRHATAIRRKAARCSPRRPASSRRPAAARVRAMRWSCSARPCEGNADLVSAVTVQRSTARPASMSRRRSTATTRPARSVDYGPVLPYLIGRARARQHHARRRRPTTSASRTRR